MLAAIEKERVLIIRQTNKTVLKNVLPKFPGLTSIFQRNFSCLEK